MNRWMLVLASLVIAGPLAGQSGTVQSRGIDSIFNSFDRADGPGCSVGVVQQDTLILARSYGEADIRNGVPNSIDGVFYLASISKQFTAMSVVLLAEDGKLHLTDDVRRWVPEVPNLGHITLLDLLHHTSGLRDYYTLLGITGWRSNELFTQQRLLDLISRQRALNFAPGTEFLYNNTGYALLAVVVQRASGQSLRDFAAARIFRPLGMTHTQYRDDHSEIIPGEAIGYTRALNGWAVNIPQIDVVGDGGVFSTVEDLAKWDRNLSTGTVGGRDGVALLLTPGKLADGTSTGYALGLNVGTFNGARLVSHSGSFGGYQSTYLRFPDQHLSVITLCNVMTPSSLLAEQVAMMYMMRPYFGVGDAPPPTRPLSQPRDDGAIQAPDEQLWVEGRYFSDELDMEVAIRSTNATLVMSRPVGEDLVFRRVGRDQYATADHLTLAVERDPSGFITGVALSTGRARGIRFVKRSGLASFGGG